MARRRSRYGNWKLERGSMNGAVEAGPEARLLCTLGNYATAVGTLSINGKSITKSRDVISRPCAAALAPLPKFLDKIKQERYAILNLKGHRGVRAKREES